MNTEWIPGSWREKKTEQQAEYRDQELFKSVLDEISGLPPIVFPGQVDELKNRIALAGEGRAFLLQGGDCVERFSDCEANTITNKLKILLQMSVILAYAARSPVVRIGRIAGQYAKPRSSLLENSNGKTIPAYRGDSINGFEASVGSREPDPVRLRKSYFYSAATLNFIRAMIDSGFADLHHPYSWNLHAIEKSTRWNEYREIVEHILDAIHFMESFGGVDPGELGRIDFYTSHEGLILPFEEAMTRRPAQNGKYYDTSAHMLWIGDRTRAINSGHVEFFRGIANPVGVKLGPGCDPAGLAELVKLLNPENEAGKIILITRLGNADVGKKLPEIIRAVRQKKLSVTWSCDPMHGNTTVTQDGYKTRDFARILSELEETFRLHRAQESRLAGVHFELTGEDVTECTGGAQDIRASNLSSNYKSYCDPRLNYNQSLEMAFMISKMLKNGVR